MTRQNQFHLALEELRKQFSLTDAHGNIIDSKAKDLIANSSIILTLFGGLQSTVFAYNNAPIYFQGLGVIFTLFLILTSLLMYCIQPRIFETPFEPTEDGVNETILDQRSEKDALEQLVLNYIARIQTNSAENFRKAKILKISYWLFFLIILLAIAFQFFVVRLSISA